MGPPACGFGWFRWLAYGTCLFRLARCEGRGEEEQEHEQEDFQEKCPG